MALISSKITHWHSAAHSEPCGKADEYRVHNSVEPPRSRWRLHASESRCQSHEISLLASLEKSKFLFKIRSIHLSTTEQNKRRCYWKQNC